MGGDASMMPVMPPNRNMTRKPTVYSIGGSKVSWPRHMVPTQLKNFTPVGTAIRNVMNEKNGSSTAPVVNMWGAHSVLDRPSSLIVAAVIVLYALPFFGIATEIIPVAMPKKGSARM